MKRVIILLSVILLASAVRSEAEEISMQSLSVVPSVDLARYAGTWYEIARLPNPFQKQCAGDVTAMYTLLEDGTIKVVNRCRRENGQVAEAIGKAKVAEQKGPNTKLKVRFAPAVLSFLPFVWGDYWIIDLAPDYSYAVVGDPARKYLWVLSRTPVLDETVLQSVLDKVKATGYDLSGLLKTTQTSH